MHETTYVTLRERLAMAKQAEEHYAQPEICPDCGIDLPHAWHWDGCTRAGVREVRRSFLEEVKQRVASILN